MRIDADFDIADISTVHDRAAATVQLGYDGLWVGEGVHDPFVLLAAAARAAGEAQLGTAIAVALARTPMTVAYSAHDLQRLTNGRFVLGIGSQVKAHIERRFDMPWSRPAARMREFILALQAIWESWNDGTRLNFEGDFYSHTLMSPIFSPPASDWGPPPVLLAAVGPLMTEVAGEVADGLLVHPFTTLDYLVERTLPDLERGRARRSRPAREPFEIIMPVMIGTSDTEEGLARAIVEVRRQIAIYGSTPAYRRVLEQHGWGELQTVLHRLFADRRWDDLPAAIDDDVLAAFSVNGTPEDVGRIVAERFAGHVTRVSLYFPDKPGPEVVARLLAAIRAELPAGSGVTTA